MIKKINLQKISEIGLLIAIIGIYALIFHKMQMWPDPNDPIEYIDPSVWHTFIGGYFPWIDRVVIANGVRLFSFFWRPMLAGAIYFGVINFLILIVAVTWSYLKKGFYAAFLTGIFLAISYPLIRYANYGYPDATMALFSLLAAIFYYRRPTFSTSFLTGLMVALAVFSKITGLAFLLFFFFDLLIQKKYWQLKSYLTGIISGTIAILITTGFLFDFRSVWYVITALTSNIADNTAPRQVWRSLGNMIGPEIWLPAYLGLILFSKKVTDFLNKKIFHLAWVFIVFFIFLFLTSGHIKAYPHYLYPANIFATIGLGWYLADKIKFKLLHSGLILLLIIIGFYGGLSQAHYFYGLTHFKSPLVLMIGYSLFALIGFILLVRLSFQQIRRLTLMTIVFFSLAGSFFVTGTSYSIIRTQRAEIDLIYGYARQIAQTPKNNEGKIIVRAELSVLSQDRQNRILWVYSSFFDQRFDRRSQIDNLDDIRQNVEFKK